MTAAQDTDALQGRVVELETRLAFQEHALEMRVSFQEHALAELSDALAELRTEAARSADLLRRVLEEVKLHRGDLMADPAEEPPPPHYCCDASGHAVMCTL